MANVKEFFFDMNYTDGWSQYQNTAYLLGKLEAPNVEVNLLLLYYLILNICGTSTNRVIYLRFATITSGHCNIIVALGLTYSDPQKKHPTPPPPQ